MRRIPISIVALVFLAVALLLIASCGGPSGSDSALGVEHTDPEAIYSSSYTPSPNTFLPQVMIDDVIYYLSGSPNLTTDIPESCYTGYITSIVSLTQRVTENGQANFNVDEGSPYAQFGDGYAVLWNGSWTLFVTENDFIAGVMPTPQRIPGDTPESAPRLDVVFTGNNVSEQRVQAIQLTTSWSVTYEDGTGRGYEADSAHALQVRLIDYDTATLNIGGAGGRINLLFSDDYPPQSVSVKRWNAEYATGSQDIMGVLDKSDYVEASDGFIVAISDGFDYIYEVYATWANGSSYYAFRLECSPSEELYIETPVSSNTIIPAIPVDFPGVHRYEIRTSLHDSMPEYLFMISWCFSEEPYILSSSLEIYDESDSPLKICAMSNFLGGPLMNYPLIIEELDTMGLYVIDVNSDGYKDVIIFNSFAGAKGSIEYDCWLWDVESSSFVGAEALSASDIAALGLLGQ